ncbi:DNA polymerase III subunit alpha [Gynuella sp.]|uniref:DNA polymerase III subunit alpha n=1 Tax=Gynuella sp. TaxID=2969146 RepID=UPI003D111126
MKHPFIHLHLHTEFSLIDGIVKVKKLLQDCVERDIPAVAITDLTNMFGLVKFYQGALSSGIKPILGSDLWIENPEQPEHPFRVTALAQNTQGYRNLTELISMAYQHNQKMGYAQTKREWLFDKNDGLIVLSGARAGEIGFALERNHMELAEQIAAEWQSVFGDRFYLELLRTKRPGEELIVQGSVEIARRLSIAVVATNDVVFLRREDFEAHETRVCINEGVTLGDPRREQRFTEEQYLKSSEEMCELFSDIPSAVENSWHIAQRCTVPVHLGEYFLPEYPIPEDFHNDPFFDRYPWADIQARVERAMRIKTPDPDTASKEWQKQVIEGVFFQKVSIEGLEERLEMLLRKDDPDYEAKKQVYFDRLNFELDIIIQMGFPGYFLIVMDFIQWAKNNDIPVGPGRGSGAGSLVAYAQKITDLDPLEYDLLFERFLNPERVSMPDFDVDFCMENRDKVIAYVAEAYGREAVSQIVTFGTMAAKAVVRDVARVQGKSYGLADKLSKMIPGDPGMTLAKAWDGVAELQEFVNGDEEAQEIWEMAQRLEGITRQTGKHAGGVVIAPTKLTDFSPLLCEDDGTGLVTQFDKNDVESAGLVKFDFLGLRTLTIIHWAMKTINQKRRENGEPELRIEEIPLADKDSFTLLKKAETTAVFQLESRGMKDLIRRLQPDNIEDMIALVALFRPGPLESGMVDDFINRKHRRAPVAYPHPDYQHESLKPILEPTYGVIVYQEQVMQIAQVLAGYTLGGADLLRRAMGKKKPEEMAKQRAVFEEGAKSQGIDPDLAVKIFDLVEKFAGYGFNKSHSAAYALVSYQTLWLKTHYPAAFMAAVMSSDMQNTDKVVIFIEDCRKMGLVLLPPDVNKGEYMFTVDDQDQIIYGLGAVKGVGEGPVEAIVQARKQGGEFKDLFDFCARVDHRVNKRVIEALIRCGALDSIVPSRPVAEAAMESAVKAAEQAARNESAGMFDLFGELEAEQAGDPYEMFLKVHEWSAKQRLLGEKETLGLYLTGHPIDEYEHELKNIVDRRLSEIEASKSTQTLAGLIIAIRTMKTRKGDTMAFVTLDDRTARVEVALFSDTFNQYREYLVVDSLIVVEGDVSWDNYSERNKVLARSVFSMADARKKLISGITIEINDSINPKSLVKDLQQCLTQQNDGCPLFVDYHHSSARALVRINPQLTASLDDQSLHMMRQLFGEERVKLRFRREEFEIM